MRRLLLLPIVASLALLAFAVPASADDGYQETKVPTSCRVTVPSAVVGERVKLRVVVSASTNVALTGSVEVTVKKRGADVQDAWTRTVRYEDSPQTIVGPRISRGEYVASIRFTPDDTSLFIGCDDSVGFGGDGVVGGEEEGGNLPETGGPHLLLLLAGLGLLVAGAGLIGESRRSPIGKPSSA